MLAPLVLQTERSLHGIPVIVGRRSRGRKFNVTKVIYLPHITAEVSAQWGSCKKEQGLCKERREPSSAVVLQNSARLMMGVMRKLVRWGVGCNRCALTNGAVL